MEIEKELLETLINIALDKVYKYDEYLIANSPVENKNNHVSERGIVFRFGIYLQNLIEKYNCLKDYNLDMEYNRNFCDPKILPLFPHGTYPDMIIHKRGSNDFNLLVIEFKTWWNRNNDRDIQKIKKYMSIEGKYKYQFGLSITLNQDKPNLSWIKPEK